MSQAGLPGMGKPNLGVITVTTGSRLHFGLMRSGPPFGGLGVIIDQPQNVITIEPSNQWRCDSKYADRVLPIARRLIQYAGTHQLPDCNVRIQQGLASHCGLGSGTQLSLAIAEGLCKFAGVGLPPLEIATKIANRGKRSAVGVHGYFDGGLIFELPASQGESPDNNLNHVAQRIELPETWRIAFLLPPAINQSISGENEAECFARLGKEDPCHVEELTRIVQNQILPAAASSDFAAFCDAVAQYNQQSGMLFTSVQGGAYNGQEVTSLIELLRQMGLQGVGQSSWGPGVFAWFDSQESLEQFQQLSSEHRYRIMATARVKNVGRELVDLR